MTIKREGVMPEEIIKYYSQNNIERRYTLNDNGNRDGLYETYYYNGQVETRGFYKDGKEDGVFEWYHSDGQLYRKQPYKNGKMDGLYEEYFGDGKLGKKYTCKDGKMDGPYEEYFENGNLKKKCAYKDDKLDGSYEEYYENGKLKKKCTYKNGKKDGPYEDYHENGQLDTKCAYKDGEYDGLYEEYTSDGQLLLKIAYKHGKENGPYEKYSQAGKLVKKCVYKDGEYDGPYEEYSNDGKLLFKCVYKDSEYDGPYEEYYKTGNLKKKCTYKNGEYDGSYEEYYENGQLETKCTYKNGKKDGSYEDYHENGQLDTKCAYKDGEYDGPYEDYLSDGQLRLKCTYNNGHKEGLYEEYNYYGRLDTKCTYKNGKLEGLYEAYFNDGKLRERCTYKDGKLEGIYEGCPMRSGVSWERCTYKNGKKDGPYEAYYGKGKLAEKSTYKDDEICLEKIVKYYENGQIEVKSENGLYERFGEKGNLLERYTHANGKREGEYVAYDDDGRIKRRANYKNDELDGEYVEYYDNGRMREKATYKNGKMEGEYSSWSEQGYLREIYDCHDDGSVNKFRYEYYHKTNYGSLNEHTRTAKIDMSTEDYYGNWSSAGRLSERTYQELSTCKNLEVLEIAWTNVDAKAISNCKKLKSLTIYQINGWGESGYGFTGKDLDALGTLPELEYLSICAHGLHDWDVTLLREQFPKLKCIDLSYTGVGREGAEWIAQAVPDFTIRGHRSSDTITRKSLEATLQEEARINGLIGDDYPEKFKKAVEKGDAKEAFEIMCYNGKMQRRTAVDNSRFEREFNTPTTPGWGQNYLDERNILNQVRMKDLGNGNVAFVTQYESMYWHSTVGKNDSGIDYSYDGDVYIVNPEKGVLAQEGVHFNRFLEPIDIKVADGKVSVKGVSLPINPLEKTKGKVKKQLDKATKDKDKGVKKQLEKAAGGLKLEARAPKKAPSLALKNKRGKDY